MPVDQVNNLSAHASSPPPDWSSIAETHRCPLCDYDLRGLVQPRCPECGFQFQWDEIFTPGRQLHPYLFELHPERNVWSYFATKLGGAAPWRFWQKLRPTTASRPRRLLLYWLISAPLVSLALVGGFVEFARHSMATSAIYRRNLQLMLATHPDDPGVQQVIARYGSVDKALDARAPRPYSARFIGMLYDLYRRDHGWMSLSYAWLTVIAFICWPWLTFAALLLFQASLRHARVRPVHVLRCAVYSCDAALVAAVMCLVLMPSELPWSRWGIVYVFNLPVPQTSVNVAIVGAMLAALTLYKLGFACWFYLRLKGAWAVAVASQVLVILAVVAAAQLWQEYLMR
jgi:hypothetical protein